MRKLALLLFLSFAVHAQQESLRMAYPFLPLAINPADAGAQKIFSAKGVFRKKPLFQTIGGASSSQQLMSIDMPMKKGVWGVGFLAFNIVLDFFDNLVFVLFLSSEDRKSRLAFPGGWRLNALPNPLGLSNVLGQTKWSSRLPLSWCLTNKKFIFSFMKRNDVFDSSNELSLS